jgi:MoaA/NifB/PqqE/SkfB family radical SAM enzyme
LEKPRVFFRDDDVCSLSKKFLKIHKMLMRERIPVTYAVIPAKADEAVVRFLTKEKGRHRELIDFAQHGWLHENHSGSRRKYEFGGSRSHSVQRRDIRKGAEAMEKLFGDSHAGIFVPPFNGFNNTTLKAAAEENFSGFCVPAKKKMPPNQGMPFIPFHIDMNVFQDNSVRSLSLNEMVKKFLLHAKRESLLGIVLHHEAFSEKELEKFGLFLKFAGKMGETGRISLIRACDIAGRVPEQKSVIFELTNNCNLRCRMCGIWKESKTKELGLKDIESILNTLGGRLSVSLTGGECFLHRGMDRICSYLTVLLLRKKIASVNITTNGYSTARILRFLEKNKRFADALSIGVSLDGPEEIHDVQRGRKGAFRNAVRTIKGIKSRYPVPLSIKFVITPLNFREIKSTYLLSKELGCSFEPKFVENVSAYYNREETDKPAFNFSAAELKEIKEQLSGIYTDMGESPDSSGCFGIWCMLRSLESGNTDFIKKCLTPDKSLFVTSEGNVYSCIYYKPIGNIREGPLSSMLSGNAHKKIRETALSGKCRKCLSYHGFVRPFNSGFVSGRA